MRSIVRAPAVLARRHLGSGVALVGLALAVTVSLQGSHGPEQAGTAVGVDHLVVATSKTSTMEKEPRGHHAAGGGPVTGYNAGRVDAVRGSHAA